MPTVIDALLVTLGLDSSDFKKGAKEVKKETASLSADERRAAKERELAEKKAAAAQTQRAKELHRQGQAAIHTFHKIRNEVLTLAAVFTAGMGIMDFVRETVLGASALGRLSENVGMNVGQLAAWDLAMKNVGGSAEEMNGQILKAQQAVGSVKMGRPDAAVQEFWALGGSKNPATFKNAQSYLLAEADLISKYERQAGPGQALNVASRIGMDYNTFNLLRKGRGELERILDVDRGIAGMNNAQAREAQVLQTRWNDFTTQLQKSGRTILFELSPALNEIMKQLNTFAQWLANPKNNGQMTKFVDDMVSAVRLFAGAIAEIGHLYELMHPKKNQSKWSWLLLNPMVKPFFEDIGKHSKNAHMPTGSKVGAVGYSSINEMFKHMPVGAGAGRFGKSASSSVSSETNIGQITINTKATDSRGIAASIGPEISRRNLALQANTGVN